MPSAVLSAPSAFVNPLIAESTLLLLNEQNVRISSPPVVNVPVVPVVTVVVEPIEPFCLSNVAPMEFLAKATIMEGRLFCCVQVNVSLAPTVGAAL
jgi:hypothetical protein